MKSSQRGNSGNFLVYMGVVLLCFFALLWATGRNEKPEKSAVSLSRDSSSLAPESVLLTEPETDPSGKIRQAFDRVMKSYPYKLEERVWLKEGQVPHVYVFEVKDEYHGKSSMFLGMKIEHGSIRLKNELYALDSTSGVWNLLRPARLKGRSISGRQQYDSHVNRTSTAVDPFNLAGLVFERKEIFAGREFARYSSDTVSKVGGDNPGTRVVKTLLVDLKRFVPVLFEISHSLPDEYANQQTLIPGKTMGDILGRGTHYRRLTEWNYDCLVSVQEPTSYQVIDDAPLILSKIKRLEMIPDASLIGDMGPKGVFEKSLWGH